jgi:starch-binding outer membrane protein, SusD/RagB family
MKLLFTFILVITLYACENVFHEEETSIGKINSYEKLVLAANGVYAKLGEALNYAFMNENTKGDDLSNSIPVYYRDNSCFNDKNGVSSYYNLSSEVWKKLYSVIVSANNITIQFNNNNEKRINELLGEIFFIRAYCYFRLTRIYGEIPIIEDIEIKYNVHKNSFIDIYSFIENDLIKASTLLPINNQSSRIPFVTPHRGTAKALLAELYLSWAGYPLKDDSKYMDASSQAGDVIDSADFFGFGLNEDFLWLWDKEHFLNKESVFSVYFGDPLSRAPENEKNNMYRFNLFLYRNESVDLNYYSDFIQVKFYSTEGKFYNNYPANYRKEITFFTKYAYDTNVIHMDTINNCSRISYRKFFYPNSSFYSDNLFDNHMYYGYPKVYLFRYAQTLLTYAEASARSGNLNSKSYECVNKIRRRANNLEYNALSIYDLTPGLSLEIFADSVVWERAWELAGEPEGRWFDLQRLEKVEELVNLRYEHEGDVPEYPIDKNDYFSLIPEPEPLNNRIDISP